MSTRLAFALLERRLHPVLVTAAVALGVGAGASYQLNQHNSSPGHEKREHTHTPSFRPPAAQGTIQIQKSAENVVRQENLAAPEINVETEEQTGDQPDGTPVAEGLAVFHSDVVQQEQSSDTPAPVETDGPTSDHPDGTPVAEGLAVFKSAEDNSQPNPDKVYTLEEVSHHNREGDIWVCYQGGVYDVSEFVPLHPGGAKILLAAGKPLETFWSMYRIHERPEVREILQEYRIGKLSPEDCKTIPDMSNPYSTDPDRSAKKLTIRTEQPFNAEAPLDSLSDNDITPNENFFVRNHLPVPDIKPELYELKISGEGVSDKVFTLEQLKAFPKHTVRATIQCAGNGRSAMDAVKPVRGLQWGYGAISTAEWSGARLIDVLAACDYRPTDQGRHAVFEGLDRDMTQAYGASIPIEKATDPRGDVILAYEMNGSDIPRDNGYPVRVIVPGVVGARNVKWLSSIAIDESESDSHWQQKDYKGFSPSSDWEQLDYSKAKDIQELPVLSAICSPRKGDTVSPGSLTEVKGYAYSGGGREIIRVDVSADGGKTWMVADLSEDNAPEGKHWAFRRWKVSIPVPEDARGKPIDLVCKAIDRSYNSQPETFESIYNVRGVLCNAWHRVQIQCQ